MERLLLVAAVPALLGPGAAKATGQQRAGTLRAECSYTARTGKGEPEPELASHGSCVTLAADGRRVFDPEMLAAIARDEQGLGAVAVAGDGWYYVDRAGRSMRVLAWDNGPDPFAEGLARTEQGGKIGFIDRTLAVVIPPRYGFAWPFDGGRAMVCMGCAPERGEGEEHPAVVGGSWGFIDRAGREVVPIRYSRTEVLDQAARPATTPAP